MPKQYFEDFPVGRILQFGDYDVTGEAIEAYRAAFDPVPAKAELARIASGWHVAAVLSRLACDGFLLDSSSAGGPGVPRFEYFKPVHGGDRLWSRTTVLTARASRSKPHLGFVDFRFEIIRRPDDTVAVMDGGVIFGVRNPADPQPGEARASPERAGEEAVTARPSASASTSNLSELGVGSTIELGNYVFGGEEVLAFAAEFDPQPFHLDNGEAATHGHFGKIAASGWHTAAALASRLAASRGTRPAAMRGFRNLVWHRPVHVGDSLCFSAIVAEKRPAADGVRLTLRCRAVNQDKLLTASVEVEELDRQASS